MQVIDKIKNRIVSLSDSLLECLKRMDEQRVKVLFVYDCSSFVGIVTIGDIQRAIIKNTNLNNAVKEIIDSGKVYAYVDDSLDKIREMMIELRAECMPILNCKNELVDVRFWTELFKDNLGEEREKINIPVVIMAGGLGTRLKPITNIIPKPLIPIGEKTILEVILDKFQNIGCSTFYLSVNYKAEVLKYFLENFPKKYQIEYFKEPKPLGTVGSVSLIKNRLEKSFFISNCDIIIDQDYRDVYEYHKKNVNEITIITAIKSYKIPYGVIDTGQDGLISNISEKPDLTYMINTGVYILEPSVLDDIPENELYHITELIEKVMKRGGRVGCFPVSENSWTDIGDWGEYLSLINGGGK